MCVYLSQVSIYNVQGEGRVKALNLEPHMGEATAVVGLAFR